MPAKKSDLQQDVIVTPAQLRAARGLLNWSVTQLAERAGHPLGTVRKAEDLRNFRSVYRPNAELLRSTLEGAGVAFIDADDMGAGARLIGSTVEPGGSRRLQTAP